MELVEEFGAEVNKYSEINVSRRMRSSSFFDL